MAKFIGTNLKTGNGGEDYFIQKLMDYLDDSCTIYRNCPVFGAQFDVCLFAAGVGIIIFEVKGWQTDTIKYVRSEEAIVVRTVDENTGTVGETEENPTAQVRGYVYKMRSKIRQKTGKTPLVYGMLCFPSLTKADYYSKGLESVCEYGETILKDDLVSRAALFAKLNLRVRNHQDSMRRIPDFTPELMFRSRQIFESDLKLKNQSIEDTDLIEITDRPDKAAYSVFAYIPHDADAPKHITSLARAYGKGTKLYVAVTSRSDLTLIKRKISAVLAEKGLTAKESNLAINLGEEWTAKDPESNLFSVFGCSAYLISDSVLETGYFAVVNGRIVSDAEEKALRAVDACSGFNMAQYLIEHSDLKKNVIVRAGAGVGKTYVLISRIAYICHMSDCSMKEMADRIVMITFTNEAAKQMKEKIKQYFTNYYLLTGDTDCLAFINQIERMQISTIHSYAKKLISMLGIEFGYGNEISIGFGEYKLKQIVAELTDKYIVNKQKHLGSSYVRNLGMPVYQINKSILNMIGRLHNQSVDVAALCAANFGERLSGSVNGELHALLVDLVPQIEKEVNTYFKQENRVHLGTVISTLEMCIRNESNRQRLFNMQTGRPQYMFVDEFQDTDDTQIDTLVRIAKLLQYRLFVVGDVKQCIYRFRGAKENAFEQLNYQNSAAWEIFSLSKNYRTDSRLLDIFHKSFRAMGKKIVDSEQLLIYGISNDRESGRLIGTRSFNSSLSDEIFYKKISISNDEERMSALFQEVRRQITLIRKMESKEGGKLPDKAREIAILVRENWQAETIRKAGKRFGIDVFTSTGGDLYMSEPALDMLKLINALLHYDESDYLYAFVSSNFIGGGMSKARMYSIREREKKSWKKSKSTDTSQAADLRKIINMRLAESDEKEWRDWDSIIKALRTVPVLQVLRKIYGMLKPWENYGQDSNRKRNNYRLNVDLLFEELINTLNMDSVSVNSIADVLFANIISRKNVDSRESEGDERDDILVRCVTVHKAKGLEYGAVILPYCSMPIDRLKRTDMNVSVVNDGSVKIGYQIKFEADHTTEVFQNDLYDEQLEKNERMREEARILYVAMTRAIRSFSWISLDGVKSRCWQNLIWEG